MESSRRKGAVNSEAKIAVRGASSGRWAARFVDRPGPAGSSKWDRGGETDIVVVSEV
jgi:hypothetical protein